MSRPIALYGVKVLPGEMVPGDASDEGLPFRVTMAAIDPTGLKADQSATLKLLKRPIMTFMEEDSDDDSLSEGVDDLSEEDQELLRAEIMRLAKQQDEEGSEDEEDEDEDEEDEEDEKTEKLNGVAGSDEDEEDSDMEEEDELEEFVLCTIKPGQNQQTLDLAVGDNDEVYFQNIGDTPIYLTGNYYVDPTEDDYDSEDDEYDLSPDEDELINGYSDEESDELDSLEDEKIQEILDEAEPKKALPNGKKRAAEESADETTLDEVMADDGAAAAEEPETKPLSKKERKKLKANDGKPVGVKKDDDKTVKFAKNLEQGPSPGGQAKKLEGGVTVLDKKIGTGRKIKAGDRIGVRYIGKLENGKVFDSNKSGKPFRLTVGKGEVIKGWDIGLAGMALEGERLVTVPPAMAYGKKAMGGIPANSTLRFEVKLVEVK